MDWMELAYLFIVAGIVCIAIGIIQERARVDDAKGEWLLIDNVPDIPLILDPTEYGGKRQKDGNVLFPSIAHAIRYASAHRMLAQAEDDYQQERE